MSGPNSKTVAKEFLRDTRLRNLSIEQTKVEAESLFKKLKAERTQSFALDFWTYVEFLLEGARQEREDSKNPVDKELKRSDSRGPIQAALTILQTAKDFVLTVLKLWWGNPKTRFPRFMALTGTPLITSPWWQSLVLGIASKLLDADLKMSQQTEDRTFWSGWALIAIGTGLYIRATRNVEEEPS